ncbi:RNA polymerase subunit sigma-70, partial [Streptomyces sp. NPDC048279]
MTNSDGTGFTTLVEGHRREPRVHCYRLPGSCDEADDLPQETFLRARRARPAPRRRTRRRWPCP